MNCEAFEARMADALGDELAPAERAQFDEHLSSCAACRAEYASNQATVDLLRSLPGPQRATAGRRGRRLVLSAHGVPGARTAEGRKGRMFGRPFRFAASVLVAFMAGYAAHAGLMMRDAARDTAPRETLPFANATAGTTGGPRLPAGESLESALLAEHRRDPSRADLAKCMVAVFDLPHRASDPNG